VTANRFVSAFSPLPSFHFCLTSVFLLHLPLSRRCLGRHHPRHAEFDRCGVWDPALSVLSELTDVHCIRQNTVLSLLSLLSRLCLLCFLLRLGRRGLTSAFSTILPICSTSPAYFPVSSLLFLLSLLLCSRSGYFAVIAAYLTPALPTPPWLLALGGCLSRFRSSILYCHSCGSQPLIHTSLP
jgi:hypothetical protein